MYLGQFFLLTVAPRKLSVLESPLHQYGRPFSEVGSTEFRQFSPDHNIVKISLLLFLPVPRGPIAIRCQHKTPNLDTSIHFRHIRIARQIADQKYFVQTAHMFQIKKYYDPIFPPQADRKLKNMFKISKKTLNCKGITKINMQIKSFLSANLSGKRVILRVDYNVPLSGKKITDDNRIRESLPTIRDLLKNNCRIVIISHLGRPEGKKTPSMSLAPAAKRLQKLLHRKVRFVNDCLGPEVEHQIAKMKEKEILMLENLRFYPGEENNDRRFAHKLSQWGQIYIDDAFGCAHRAHASITSITEFLPSYAGHLLLKEYDNLSRMLHGLRYPVTMVIGGAKIDSKIDLIKNFAGRVDHFILGGGIANTFLAAKKQQLGDSLVQKDKIGTARLLEQTIRRHHKNLHLPTDFITASRPGNYVLTHLQRRTPIPTGQKIFDVGPRSAGKFATIVRSSKTVIWNGPLGVCEARPFRKGTRLLARSIAAATKKGATTIVGGGDTVDALKTLHISHRNFTHVSTGGGAMLEFLEKGSLPGLEVLTE